MKEDKKKKGGFKRKWYNLPMISLRFVSSLLRRTFQVRVAALLPLCHWVPVYLRLLPSSLVPDSEFTNTNMKERERERRAR